MNTNKKGKSLEEVHASIDTIQQESFWKKLFAFLGPAYLISVGYMDPGNWATDIAGGSKFGYTLIWVLLMSNLIALLLQSMSARLGLVRGLDLAQATRQEYNKVVNFLMWILAEIAIAACDLAEIIGMAIGLHLLFGLPLLIGVCITVTDTILLLILQRYGMRKMEVFIIGLIATIGMAFIVELFFAKPDGLSLLQGFVPKIPDKDALYIAIGIIGATVMPHNLYLHSSLVQTRKYDKSPKGIKTAIKFNLLDTTIALNIAFFVNAAILVLAAATFYGAGLFNVQGIQDAYKFLAPLLGHKIAPAIFAIALIAAGQSSTLTGTLAGQIVMEGHLNLRLQPWLRRLITRLLAIIPAFLTIWYLGDASSDNLLILSQVILSIQLGFAVIPLVHFVSNKKQMGEFSIRPAVMTLAWTCVAVIVSLNVYLIYDTLHEWISQTAHPGLFYFLVLPITFGAGILLLYIAFKPLMHKRKPSSTSIPHGEAGPISLGEKFIYNKVAVTLDFSSVDAQAINYAIAQGGKDAEYILIHTVETAGAFLMENEIADYETGSDKQNLERYAEALRDNGYRATTALGYGSRKSSIPAIVKKYGADLLVMGAHGHRGIKDILFGTTVDTVRHRVDIPVLIISP